MLRIMSHPIEIMKLLVGGDMDFSLEEKKVGTWIDGKPVYQRTWEITTTNGLKLTDTGDIKKLIHHFGEFYYDNNHQSHNFPWNASGGVESCMVSLSSNDLYLFLTGTIYVNKQGTVTCLYTKTTD